MSQVMVVSNRGPLSFRLQADGELQPVPAGGGLVSALGPLLSGGGATWASVTMGAADREAVAKGRMVDERCALLPVVIDDDTYRQAYDVIANSTLWYAHHHLFDLPRRPRFDRHWRLAWEGFRRYNQAVADVVSGAAEPGATVLVQDYHFSLLGRMLAEQRADLRTVHFCHIPFADPHMLQVLPDAAVSELLAGLAGFGACGFHAHTWEAGFRACYAAAGRTRRARSSRRSRPTTTGWRRRRPVPNAPVP
jgi:trehalose 6-phosphate synthase